MSDSILALRFRALSSVYDAFMRLTMKDKHLKSFLVSQMNIKAGDIVLDFGCGTGTLMVMIKRTEPGCRVMGVDIEPLMLEIAEWKARKMGVDLEFTGYNGVTLPYPDGSFSTVVSSFVVHHLRREERPRLFREIFRVTRNGGSFYVMDFGIPRSAYAKAMSSVLSHIEPIGDNIHGKVPGYLEEAGFGNVREFHREGTLYGTVSLWGARK